MGRAELPLPNESDASSGSYRGASCMSWRQPAETTAMNASAASKIRLVLNGHHLTGIQALEERPGLFGIEVRIGRFDGQEETGLAGQREAFRIEHRVIGL